MLDFINNGKEFSIIELSSFQLDKMNQNKIFHLKSLGAEVMLAKSDVGPDSPEHYVNMAKRVAAETDISFMANQFTN